MCPETKSQGCALQNWAGGTGRVKNKPCLLAAHSPSPTDTRTSHIDSRHIQYVHRYHNLPCTPLPGPPLPPSPQIQLSLAAQPSNPQIQPSPHLDAGVAVVIIARGRGTTVP